MFCNSEPLGSLAFYGGGLKCGGFFFYFNSVMNQNTKIAQKLHNKYSTTW